MKIARTDRPISRPGGKAGTKIIKSAKRVLELLEYFDRNHRAATVMDIARNFGYPQSSISEMLRCLVALGYLTYDRYTRTFAPTVRVAMLGSWVMPDLFRQSRLLAAVDRVVAETDCEVVVSAAINYLAYHVHRAGTATERADTDSLLHSPQGRMALAAYAERTVLAAVHRLNAAEADPTRRVRPAEFMDNLRVIKARGWDSGEDGAGLRVVTVPVPFAREERLVLSIVTQSAPEAAYTRLCDILGITVKVRPQRPAEIGAGHTGNARPEVRYSAA